MSANIHPSAIISPDAHIGPEAVIGPYCIVEGNARIGARCVLRSHVVVGAFTEMGEGNECFPHATLGMIAQDLKYKGEPTLLVIGDRNIFRENCTVHRGTEGGGGLTRLGNGNLLMCGVHVAHDCLLGSDNILANNAGLAGHVEIGNGAVIGAFSAIHQFCRVGDHAFIGGFTTATKDVLPFMKTAGMRETKSYGVNALGLQRKGFSDDALEALSKAHRMLYHSGMLKDEAINSTEAAFGQVPEVAYLLRFIRESKRGVHRG